MPSITTWTRLEPEIAPSSLAYDSAARDALVAVGIQARVTRSGCFGRQWQFGEFQGGGRWLAHPGNHRHGSDPDHCLFPVVPLSGSHGVAKPT